MSLILFNLSMGSKSNKKFLIIGTGRTGSSLLSAILLKSGANFGLDTKDIWNRDKGDFEHPLLHEAYKWHSRAEKIDQSILPNYFFVPFSNQKCNKTLNQLLSNVNYAKSSQLLWLVHRINFKLGYEVKIIGVYRKFSAYLLSRYKKYGRSLDYWREHWLQVNKTLVLQTKMMPSLLLSYEEMVNNSNQDWLEKLAVFTNRDREKLSLAAGKIIDRNPYKINNFFDLEDKETLNLYEKLKKF